MSFQLISEMVVEKDHQNLFSKMHSICKDQNAKELSENDDLATSLIVDVMLGFQTHKMNPRYKPLRINRDELRKILDEFIKNQNYEKTMASIQAGEWIPRSFHGKSKLLQRRLYAHVSTHSKHFNKAIEFKFNSEGKIRYVEHELLLILKGPSISENFR